MSNFQLSVMPMHTCNLNLQEAEAKEKKSEAGRSNVQGQPGLYNIGPCLKKTVQTNTKLKNKRVPLLMGFGLQPVFVFFSQETEFCDVPCQDVKEISVHTK